MGFRDEWARDVNAVMADASAVLDISAQLALQSIQFGSPLTAAPGQPVDKGNLRNSWQDERVSPTEHIVSTPIVYADNIEDGISSHGTPMTLRSAVGGFHSVALTVSNFDRIVDAAVEAVGSAGGSGVR
jgi:hypothetical protein